MAASASDVDEFVCSSHPDCVVALWCQTCEELICPRCISQGPSGSQTHTSHVYLDLNDAYSLKQEEFKKVMMNFADTTQSKRNERAELSSRIQSLKFELLRKKTRLSHELRILHSALKQHSAAYERYLEALIAPALTRQEALYTLTDYDVVSRDALLVSSECVQKIPAEKCVQYLRGQMKLEKEMVTVSASSQPLQTDALPELHTLRATHLSLQRERRQLTKALAASSQVPSKPKLLPSWCVIAATMATIVFKCSKKTLVNHFIVQCTSCDKPPKVQNFKIRKFSSSGRITAVLRNLTPGTTYGVVISAVNSSGDSSPAATCTIHMATKNYSGRVSFVEEQRKRSVCRNLCYFLMVLLLSFTFCAFLAWTIYALYLSSDQFMALFASGVTRVCDEIWHQNITELNVIYEYLYPKKIQIVTMEMDPVAIETDEFSIRQEEFSHGLWDWLTDLVDFVHEKLVPS